jgi:hypothetical protein
MNERFTPNQGPDKSEKNPEETRPDQEKNIKVEEATPKKKHEPVTNDDDATNGPDWLELSSARKWRG